MKLTWQKTLHERGILVAFDKTMQPLLLWWYKNLRKHCSYPVAFISLRGINENVKNWCKQNGYFYDVEEFVEYFKTIKIPFHCLVNWSKNYSGDVASVRPYWFAKPISIMQTPFLQTLYLDIDCEVKAPLDGLFSELNEEEMCISEDKYESIYLNKEEPKKIIYNSGVILYKSGAKIIEKWALRSLKYSHDFPGDQDLLSYIIYKDNFKPKILSKIWNFEYSLPNRSENVKILHYNGGKAKLEIIEKIQKDKVLFKETKKLLFG